VRKSLGKKKEENTSVSNINRGKKTITETEILGSKFLKNGIR